MENQPVDTTQPADEQASREARRLLAESILADFLRKAGHDMRGSLAAIGGVVGAILATADELTDEHRKLLERARQRVGTLMALLSDLKWYSNLQPAEAGLPPASQRKVIQLGSLVRGVLDGFRQRAQCEGIELSGTIEEVAIPGDAELVGELIGHLVANAIQYTPAGGQVHVGLRVANGCATLSVADTGIGISDQARAQLFKEFYRAPEARRIVANGTGLGLAICRRIVEMHGGHIRAESGDRPEAGGGSRGSLFTAELPVAAVQPETGG